ncbi:hypothetical protein DMP17_44815 [Pseudonocardia sp. TMWB2A]|uniref:hypothetical protein n=1 Tax=Pseudonocardia sp. TMWB2A TaxID=687430 RepID=UPI00307CFF29
MTSQDRDARTVLVDFRPVRMLAGSTLIDELGSGDWFVGPSGELSEVPCSVSSIRTSGPRS